MNVHHVPGKDLAVADDLSRLIGHPSYTPLDEEVFTMQSFATEEVTMNESNED